MSLERFAVVHQRKTPGRVYGAEWPLPASGFRLETCLRRLAVGDVAELSADPADAPAFDQYRGAAAYEFLLRIASGLESEIAGETEVFGQLKEAWRAYES